MGCELASKTILIVGLLWGLAIGVIGGLLMTSTGNEILNEINPVSTYDCAKEFDKLATIRDTSLKINDPKYTPMLFYQSLELMENLCFITFESWADKSDYEQVIRSVDWEALAHTNQVYLGEIPCSVTDDCEFIEAQKKMYLEYKNSQK